MGSVVAVSSASQPRPGVVLLSGGLDSTTVIAIARRDGFQVHTLSFDYGQRHKHEIDASRRVAEAYGIAHKVVHIDLRVFGGSALTSEIEVPKGRDVGSATDVPVTYVPARNTILLSYALAYAEVIGARDIFIGVNALDYSGYPDCRPEYIEAFEVLANLATKVGAEAGASRDQHIRIHAPLMRMTKAEIVELGTSLGVDYSLTTSCYDPSPTGAACGECDACQLRLRGFEQAGRADPVAYVSIPSSRHAG